MDVPAQAYARLAPRLTQDVPSGAISGWWALILAPACFRFSGLSFVGGIGSVIGRGQIGGLVMLLAPAAYGLGIVFLVGLVTIGPRQAAVLTLFGRYKGTIARDGKMGL